MIIKFDCKLRVNLGFTRLDIGRVSDSVDVTKTVAALLNRVMPQIPMSAIEGALLMQFKPIEIYNDRGVLLRLEPSRIAAGE